MKHFKSLSLMSMIMLLTLSISSCGGGNKIVEKQQDPKTIVDPQNRQDTVYFNYILGQETKSITDKLIAEGKFNSKYPETKSYRMSIGGYTQTITCKGYPFDLYIADQKYDAQLVLYNTEGKRIDDNGKLMSLRIYIEGSKKYPIINALKQQYGEKNNPPKDGYKVDVPDRLDAFWNISNKAIYIESFSSYMVLIYEDIIAVRDLYLDMEKTEKANKEANRKYNEEQSQRTSL